MSIQPTPNETHLVECSLMEEVPVPEGLIAGPWRLEEGRSCRTLSNGSAQRGDGSIYVPVDSTYQQCCNRIGGHKDDCTNCNVHPSAARELVPKADATDVEFVDLAPVELDPPPPRDYWVIDRLCDPDEMRGTRHPRAIRKLTAAILVSSRRGEAVATAFEFPATERDRGFWRVDIESYTIKAAGLRPLALNAHGFYVHDEDEARDWLHLFGALALAANKAGDAR